MGARISGDRLSLCMRMLRQTELSMAQIGRRVGISDRSVGLINRRYGIRQFVEGPKVWIVDGERMDARQK